ncbi:hypothetical protein LFL96_06140 [Paraburkholderia sp. D15]|uniref:hypothetical protein n=1 Tax=Paraburkholderia sp. D15 TaxID=2880218 RepID=UPI0024798F3C|nr:hypothetical protein [Paraburkholderia sp. D15]WGS51080.1 hypothetical protein LFL96_06140 [Paraburkholderia sp. D15]WKF59063.1 hypothetical protein HUO10_003571 [Paraburkholderia busanensis]
MNVSGIGNFYGAGGGNSSISPSGSLSTGGLLGLLEKILAKENNKVNGTLQQAENADGLQQGGGNAMDGTGGNNQGNVEMLRAQQAVGELSTFNTAATNMLQTVNDSQKSVAQNTK